MRVSELLQDHWVALLILLLAGLGALTAYFLKQGRFSFAVSGLSFGFALGGLLGTNRTLDSLLGRFDLAFAVMLVAIGILFAAFLFLILTRRWSAWTAYAASVFVMFGLGGLIETSISSGLLELGRSVRGLHFVRPGWLLLLVLVPVVVLLAQKSLSGLGPMRKWLAISARALVVALLVMALAEPRIRWPSDTVTVLFVVDRSFSVPQDVDPEAKATEQIDRRWQRIQNFIDQTVRERARQNRRDQAGVILFGKRPKLALPPAATTNLPVDDRMAGPIDGQYTNISAALKLAMASFPESTGRRIVLLSDGNENMGAAEEQAAIAVQNGISIDVIALAPGYRNENEVLVQNVEAPPVTATGTRLPVRVLIRNANPTRSVDGLLELIRVAIDKDGNETSELVPVDAEQIQVLDVGGQTRASRIRLNPGLNSIRFRDKPASAIESSFSYRATFTPIQSVDADGGRRVAGLPLDRVANNRASTAVVTTGQRRILFLDKPVNGQSQHQHLIRTLLRAKMRVDVLPVSTLPQNKGDATLFLSNYDCVVIANVPAEELTGDQMEAIRSSVHDQGCGLVMIGGPDSYGPGGYQSTPVEAALPVDCEIKAIKAAGKGGLILIMHASEMADGNKWQKEVAKLAIQRLNPQDMVGVTQYGFGGGNGVSWVIPFQEIGGNKGGLMARIDQMTPGDMPHFDPFLTAAVDTLINPDHNLAVKHCIIISDGDPILGAAGKAAIAKMAENQVTCTTVGVATHGPAQDQTMTQIAEGTRDGKGNKGNYYNVKNPEQLPAIYIKESRRVSQSFIYDKPFTPQLRMLGGPIDGVSPPLPTLRGFVRTTKKDSPLADMRIEGPQVFDQKFPILASWQYGLGKAVAFTADARSNPEQGVSGWDVDWVQSDVYRKFWEQAINWSMRAAEKGKLAIQTEYRDGQIRVTVDARDEAGRPLAGLELNGGLTLPQPLGPGEKPPQVVFRSKGSGRYEAIVSAQEAGSYYLNVEASQPGLDGKKGERFDSTRAGITVPYSPEFADLESNTPLMRRLAEQTNGRYSSDDPADLQRLASSGELYRETPQQSGAITPFWFWLVFAAAILLLFDVGVRRVAIEWIELQTTAERTWKRLRTSSETVEVSEEMSRLRRRKVEVAESLDRERAARRFDAASAPPPSEAPLGADEVLTSRPTSPPPPPVAKPVETKPGEVEDTFSKLQKAKKRARDRIERKEEGEGE